MFSFDTQGGKAYLVYKFEADDSLSSFTLNMLQNSISGLAPFSFYQIDEESFIRYEITSRITAKDFFLQEVKRAHLLNYLESVVGAVKEIEEYMIDSRTLCLEEDRIFVDVNSGKAVLICLPLEMQGKPEPDWKEYFKSFMYSRIINTYEDASYVIQINNYLNGQAFSAEGFAALIQDLKRSAPTLSQQNPRKAVNKPGEPAAPIYGPPPVTPVQPSLDGPQKKWNQEPNTSPASVSHPPVNPAGIKHGFEIPGRAVVQPINTPHGGSGNALAGEKPMSLLYLLNHYSKENAAIYKNQKAQKQKGGKAVEKASSTPKKGKDKKRGTKLEFSIPGQVVDAPPIEIPGKSNERVYGKFQPSGQPSYSPPVAGGVAWEGGTVLLESMEDTGTTILDESVPNAEEVKAVLWNAKSGVRVIIDKAEFRLGRSREYADYSITENRAVGSLHAKIITRDGKYFVVDMNSKNHTYVNGSRINSMVEVPVQSGDSIRLANEELRFEITTV